MADDCLRRPADGRRRRAYVGRATGRRVVPCGFVGFRVVLELQGPLVAVKTTINALEWLSEPDVLAGDEDIERMDSLDCAPAYTRPLVDQVVAPPSLVSRMLRKSSGLSVRHVRLIDSGARSARSVGLPPTVALALSLSED